MYSLLFLIVASLALSLVLTPVCRNLFRRWGFVDLPDEGRKLHRDPVPRVGGIAIALASAGAFGLLLLSPLRASGIVQGGFPLAWKLAPAVILVFATGLLDDLAGMKPWQKLAGQTAGALWAYFAGVQIQGLGGYTIDGWLSLPLTVGWFLLCTNAFNLIDGVDGLAAGIGLFAAVTTMGAALLHGNIALVLATAPLVGSLLGFLRYNFNPASIFLGDSGSLTLGFVLGCYGAIWSQKSATLFGMTAPLMALAIPLLDVMLSIARRVLRGQPVFGADRGHIHHRLLDRGLTPRRVALLLYGACGLFAALSLLQSASQYEYAGLILVLFCGASWVGIHNLGYVEFRAARRLLLGGTFQNMVNAQYLLRNFEQELSLAADPEGCWLALEKICRQFGFCGVKLRFAGKSWETRAIAPDDENCWTAHVPLCGSDYVRLALEFRPGEPLRPVAPFVESLRGTLVLKSLQFALPGKNGAVPAEAVAVFEAGPSAYRM